MFAEEEPPQGLQQDGKGPVHLMPDYVRSGFIQKVYSILGVQLIVTVLIAGAIIANCSKFWAADHVGLFYLCCFGSLLLLVGVGWCCPMAMRSFPQNYGILFALTIMQSVAVGFMSLMYTGEAVVLAVATIAVVFLGLTAYACVTKSDFTGFGPYLIAALMCMMVFALLMSVWSFLGSTLIGHDVEPHGLRERHDVRVHRFAPVPPMMRLVYAFCGVLLFSFYIVYHTQLVVGGQHKSHQFDIDDYCFAALNLYLDIINMFVYLLQIFGSRD